MLARLLLALLALVMATPAAALSCHAREAAGHHASASHHDPAPDEGDDRAVAVSACIGCIPPSNWTGARVPSPRLLRSLPAPARLPTLAPGRSPPPVLPPPRQA